jgi:hypothetical protein
MKFLVHPLWFLFACVAQDASSPGARRPPYEIGPNIPLTQQQRTALIKADHKKNVEDASELFKLAEEIKTELDKEDAQVISARTIKQTEDIERLAKSIRGRLKRY